jgi:polyhydroxyalkanoate synthase
VVGNYLKGEAPPPFDLLYWNGDSTNLPGPMYCWYLRHTYLENALRRPGALTVCGVPLDVTRITCPVFIYASREDHIVPWQAAYKSTEVLAGSPDKTFVLGASGHIAGVINPANKNKRSHWVNSKLPATSEAWFRTATETPGSWWPVWSGWLGRQAGKQVAAPKAYGNRTHKVIEAAPGRYVLQKA